MSRFWRFLPVTLWLFQPGLNIDKKYYQILLSRPERIREIVSPKMSIHSTLITTFGLVRNEYSGAFTNVVTMDDLFA